MIRYGKNHMFGVFQFYFNTVMNFGWILVNCQLLLLSTLSDPQHVWIILVTPKIPKLQHSMHNWLSPLQNTNWPVYLSIQLAHPQGFYLHTHMHIYIHTKYALYANQQAWSISLISSFTYLSQYCISEIMDFWFFFWILVVRINACNECIGGKLIY